MFTFWVDLERGVYSSWARGIQERMLHQGGASIWLMGLHEDGGCFSTAGGGDEGSDHIWWGRDVWPLFGNWTNTPSSLAPPTGTYPGTVFFSFVYPKISKRRRGEGRGNKSLLSLGRETERGRERGIERAKRDAARGNGPGSGESDWSRKTARDFREGIDWLGARQPRRHGSRSGKRFGFKVLSES